LFNPFYDSKRLRRIQKRFRKFMRRLSRLRDYDVFLLKLERYMKEQSSWQSLSAGDQLAYTQLEQYWRESKRMVDRKAKEYLDKGKYRKLLHDLGVAISEFDEGAGNKRGKSSVSKIAPGLITEKVAAVHQFSDVTTELSLAQLHALRIQMKELRYTMEFFEPLMGQLAAPLIQVMKEMLTQLGDLNDARVHIAMLEGEEGCASNPAAAGYLLVLEGELARLRGEFPSRWAAFDQDSWREGLNAILAEI